MRRLARWALLAWLALAGGAAAHEITFSHVDLALEPAQSRVSVRLPIKALRHEQPSPLREGLAVSDPGQQAVLARLLQDRLRLSAAGRPLPLAIARIAPAGEDIAFEATAPPVRGALSVQANLFPDDGLAKVFATVSRGGALAGEYALDRQSPSFNVEAPDQPLSQVILTFVGQGVRHIFIGPDHILFVLSLVLLGGRAFTQLKIVTAFTAAHSVTLALAALGLVHLPSRLVESLIALSIVVVALHNLWRLRQGPSAAKGVDPRLAFAFGFGLIHGFGFASVLGELSLPAHALAWSLAAFNLGVEIGQATIVLAAAPLLLTLHRRADSALERRVLQAAACAIAGAGLFWLVQRLLGV